MLVIEGRGVLLVEQCKKSNGSFFFFFNPKAKNIDGSPVTDQ